ncbi:inositol monophosphatase family protein [Pseudanabaena sp. FACHB-1998]|uniref:3'(2'),5'-bisphosphate nucleotidase CysQ family protein n=1 Tax=Pseudanabaena sp. FACHB-1998 TaxID=2692858 RepID=UPI00167FE8BE|nr:inositol monophosphatase family protein [Pseudanabaena sp. FACHB-1998]MBD2177629.1 inositol monophosphatase family protein [Pseudanabaena sp. FACHB-1998]
MNPSLRNEISQFIRDIGQKAIHLRTLGFQIDEKGFDDYVTNVDRELDHLLSQRFQAWFPKDIVISEENARSPELWQQSAIISNNQPQKFWFIDPIDGTDDFIHGREFYSVMVGALEDSQPVLGWIYAPKIDRLYFGGSAVNGLFFSTNGNVPEILHSYAPIFPHSDRVIVSKKDDLAYGNAIRAAVPNVEFYSLGSFGLKVMEVVQGRASAYIYLNRRVKLWDTVGPLAIAKAAGLVCCDLEGREISFGYDDINSETLTHNQLIVIGWSKFIETYLDAIAKELHKSFAVKARTDF